MTESFSDEGVEPIALVGLACRVPGARDAKQFWSNLASGTESVRFFTREEQLKMGVAQETVDDPSFVPAASVLDDVEYFDPGFFGMSRREADIADPQHRLFLELSHTALEDSGYDPARYGGEVGVYAGTGDNDYVWTNIRRNPRIGDAAGGLAISIVNSPDYVATLTSYKLNLRGPSFTLHTACSTSMVAIHLAAEALRNGECDMALAGGVCIELPHGHGYLYQEGGITSPDGHCRSFDSRAAGTIWGSGGGVVVLKRLDEAIADGDHIRALILGNAINNDGATKVGFTAPSADGQAEVVAQALGLAAIDPRTVSYVEAHGTATAIGDPIEVSALSRGYGAGSTEHGWCRLGSVKSNIGHLSHGAGVVGVIKTVLSIEHGLVPPSLNYESPNPAIDFESSPFYVNTVLSTWDREETPRRAGISSFGIGGTNAHVILEEAPEPRPRDVDGGTHLLQLSARSEAALANAVERLSTHLTEHPDLELVDVAHTLRVGRGVHAHRATVVATGTADAVAALGDRKRLVRGAAEATAPKVAFLFSGQGAQYAGMAAGVYRAEPVFAEAFDACADGLRAELGEDLRDWLFTPGDADTDEKLRQTRYTQPALFAVEYSLAKLWQSWGIEPAAMIGHSIGEYVAATLAGVFALPDALRLVAARGRLMQTMPAGSMLAVQADEESTRADLPAGLDVATVNGPGTCVVAGPTELVEQYAAALKERGVGSRKLRTSHAFHSPMMEPVLAEFTDLVAAVPRHAPTMPFLSNRTGDWITAEQACDPAYWASHLREAVRFGDCVSRLLSSGSWVMLECGPGNQLTGLVRMQVPSGGHKPVASLPGPGGKNGDLDILYATAGRLWTVGVTLDGFGASGGRRVPLPTYPYERTYHWVEPELTESTGPAEPREHGPRMRPMEEWLYVPAWRRLTPAQADGAPARCLLFGEGPVGSALAARLTAAGSSVVQVVPGSAYGRDAECRYTVRPAERDDYAAMLTDLAAADGIPPRVVHAWCLSSPADVDRGFFSLVTLGQELVQRELPGPVAVDVVTQGTQDVLGGDVTCPEHATVAGVLKALPLEAPGLVTVRHLDADPLAVADSEAGLARLATEVSAEVSVPPAGEYGETVALRGGRRWAPSYESVPLPEESDTALRDGGVYLITGGLGGIGITLAEDLAARVRARLVLTARTALPAREEWDAHAAGTGRTARAIAAIRRLEAAGGEVLVLAGDVADVADLRRMRDETVERFGRLDGIVHAAGVPGGGLIEVKERSAAEAVLAPKLAGTLALAEVFGDLDLDFVALCSSVTGVFGGIGQVDYCAASAFLDAYAHSGRGFHGRVLSIDWGGWLEVGMAAEVESPDVLKATADAAESGTTTAAVDHPLLRVRYGTPDGRGWCSGPVSPATHWVLDEHRIAGVPVMPGTGHLEVARAAVAAAVPSPGPDAVLELRDVTFLKPMPVPDGSVAELKVLLEPADDGMEFRVVSANETYARGVGGWVLPGPAPTQDLAALRERCGTAHDVPSYHEMQSNLLTFGARWSNLHQISASGDEALGRLTAPETVVGELGSWVLHPAILDEATSFAGTEGSYLPLGYGRITVHAPMPANLWSYLRRQGGEEDEVESVDIQLVDDGGRVVVDIADFMLRRIDPDAVATSMNEPATGGSDSTAAADQLSTPQPAARAGIRPAQGAEVFRRLIGTDLGAQVLVNVRSAAESFARVRSVTTDSVADQLQASGGALSGSDIAGPEGGLESSLAAIWSDVLGVDEVARDDDFFDLGGNSLVAVQLIARVRKAMHVKLPMRSLFETSTVAGMAELVEKLQAAEESTPAPDAAEAPAVTIPRLSRPQ
ncbi:MAG: SDR family NAD(P)-dependent oxidoreductase [Actinocatenispora sp.]